MSDNVPITGTQSVTQKGTQLEHRTLAPPQKMPVRHVMGQ